MGRRGGRLGISRSCVCSNSLTFLPGMLSSSSRCRLCGTNTSAPRPGWPSRAWRVIPVTATSLGLQPGCMELELVLNREASRHPQEVSRNFAKKRKQCHRIPSEDKYPDEWLRKWRKSEFGWRSPTSLWIVQTTWAYFGGENFLVAWKVNRELELRSLRAALGQERPAFLRWDRGSEITSHCSEAIFKVVKLNISVGRNPGARAEWRWSGWGIQAPEGDSFSWEDKDTLLALCQHSKISPLSPENKSLACYSELMVGVSGQKRIQ